MLNKIIYAIEKTFGNAPGGIPLCNAGIIGLSSSGKTNYITVAMQTMQESVVMDPNTGIEEDLLEGLGDFSMVFDISEDHVHNVKMIYYDKNPGRVVSTNQNKVLSIAMFHNKLEYQFKLCDTSGRDFQSDNFPEQFFGGLDALIVTIDPMSIPELRKLMRDVGMSESEIEIVSGAKAGQVSVADTLRAITKKIKNKYMPIALVLTKFDIISENPEIRKRFPGANQYFSNGAVIENGTVSLPRLRQTSREVESLLRSVRERNLTNLLPNLLKNYLFFATSSIGKREKDGTYTSVMPHRVLDPFLWILKTRGFL